MEHSLELFTFGTLAIRIDGKAADGFALRKEEALLVYLAVTGQAHAREALAELLWDERSQTQALANLRVVLAGLKRRVGPYLTVTRQTIAFDWSQPAWLDVAELEKCINLPPGASADSAAIARFDQGLALYRGDFLAGFNVQDCAGFQDWLRLERERLRREVVEALTMLGNACLTSGDLATGLKKATRLLELDPLHEEAHRQLMTLLARSGQRSEALAQYEVCRHLLKDDLGVEPEVETTALVEQIRSGKLKPSDSTPPRRAVEPAVPAHNLPVQPTLFIGRSKELTWIADHLLDLDCRLIAVTGVGGVGKTRLALKAAEGQVDAFPDGVYFVSLAPVGAPNLLAAAILGVLNISFQGNQTPENQLLDFLCNKQILLLLDNFEHLLDGAELLSQILTRAPGVKLLVTSRERLNVQEEWSLTLEGLPFPEETATTEVDSYDAVHLFGQCARRVQGNFSLSENIAAAAAICRQVEGMPLALELAASWLRVMPCEQIAGYLRSSLDILAAPIRNVPERHRSVRLVFEPSWNLLSAEEQSVLARLSVFRGGFSLDAAEKVAGATLPMLAALVDKSLIRVIPSGRYDMHELLRQYCEEKLEAIGQGEIARTAHCAYYTEFLKQRDADLKGRRVLPAVREIDADFGNVQRACGWILEQRDRDGVRLILEPLYRYSIDFNHGIETRIFWQQVMDRFTPQPGGEIDDVRTRLLVRQILMQASEPTAQLVAAVTDAISLARQSGDLAEMGFSYWALGTLYACRNEMELAIRQFEEGLNCCQQLDDPLYRSYCSAEILAWFSGCYQQMAQPAQAIIHAQTGRRLCHQIDDKLHECWHLLNLAKYTCSLGHMEESARYFREVYETGKDYFQFTNSQSSLGFSYQIWLAFTALLRGDLRAARCAIDPVVGHPTYALHIRCSAEAHRMLGIQACLEEDYAEGMRLFLAAEPNHWIEGIGIIYEWGYALAYCGLKDFEATKRYLEVLKRSGVDNHSLFALVQSLPLQSVILAQAGEFERAVELLGLASQFPSSLTGWMDQWPLLTRLRAELQIVLGAENYAAAWARSEKMDIETEIARILAPENQASQD